MAFHFTLDAVLRYRQSLEDRERMLLESLLIRRAQFFRDLQLTQEGKMQLRDAMHAGLQQAPTPAAEIQFCTARFRASEERQKLLRAQLRELKTQIDAQSERYRQQRRKREGLESLRQAQWDDYRVRQKRREQSAMDELFLLRRGR